MRRMERRWRQAIAPTPMWRRPIGVSSAGSRLVIAARSTLCAFAFRQPSTRWRAVERIAEAFETEYERLFGPGSALKDAGIELVDYGVDAIGVVDKAGGR